MNSSLFWVMGRVDGRLVLNIEEVADAIGLEVQTIYNQLGAATFPIPMRKQGKRWFADARDVAEYLDDLRAQAHAAHEIVKSARLPSNKEDREKAIQKGIDLFKEDMRKLGRKSS